MLGNEILEIAEKMAKVHKTDVVIVGAGPVGLFAIFECGMLGMKCHVVDALEEIGGQCTALYPEKPIYDIPGLPAVEAGQLIENLERQAAPFDPVFHMGKMAVSMQREEETFRITTSKDELIECKAVILAAGTGAFGPNRPPLEGLEEYEGKSVFYMVKRKKDFAGKRAVIAGGGDSAVDWTISLADVAQHVYVVHRRPKFRAAPESVARMEQLVSEGKIEHVVPAQLKALQGEGGQLTAVTVADLDGNDRDIEADILLPFFGLAASLGPLTEWGLETTSAHRIPVDPKRCETQQKGIYAVGDVADYDGKLRLILTGFSEAASAARGAYALVFPDKELHFEYSTTSGVPA